MTEKKDGEFFAYCWPSWMRSIGATYVPSFKNVVKRYVCCEIRGVSLAVGVVGVEVATGVASASRRK
jgi:hypothetical protein